MNPVWAVAVTLSQQHRPPAQGEAPTVTSLHLDEWKMLTVSARTTEKLLWVGGEWEAEEWGIPGDKGRSPGTVTHSVVLGEGVLV